MLFSKFGVNKVGIGTNGFIHSFSQSGSPLYTRNCCPKFWRVILNKRLQNQFLSFLPSPFLPSYCCFVTGSPFVTHAVLKVDILLPPLSTTRIILKLTHLAYYFFNVDLFLCLRVFPACMSVCHMIAVPVGRGSEEGNKQESGVDVSH